MANFKILSYKSNNAVGKKLRNFLKKLDKDVVCSLNLIGGKTKSTTLLSTIETI